MLGGAGKDYSAFSNSDSWLIERHVLCPGSPVALPIFLPLNFSFCFLKMSANDDTEFFFFNHFNN